MGWNENYGEAYNTRYSYEDISSSQCTRKKYLKIMGTGLHLAVAVQTPMTKFLGAVKYAYVLLRRSPAYYCDGEILYTRPPVDTATTLFYSP